MDLSDPYQAILLLFAAGTFLAAFIARTAAVLFAWWVVGMFVWPMFGAVPASWGYVIDGVAAGGVAFCAKRSGRSSDILILMLFAFPLVVRAAAEPEIDWFVSWAVGLLQMGLAMAGAILKPRAASEAADEQRSFEDHIRDIFLLPRKGGGCGMVV